MSVQVNEEFRDKVNDKLFFYIERLIYILFIIFFIFNLLSLSAIKFVYLGIIALIVPYVAKKGWQESIHIILALACIEGQGRIIWEYNVVFRLIFDLTLLLLLLIKFIKDRQVFPRAYLPNYISFLIVSHFMIYIVQLFNTDSVGFFGVLAASKIYIIPFLLFFLFLMSPVNEERVLKKIQVTIVLFFIMESLIALYQMSEGETSLLSMTSYYLKPLRGDQFTGAQFRPFGTGFNAGGFSIYYYLLVGFLFIADRGKVFNFLKNALIGLGAGAIIISQVRSALVKYFLIVGMISMSMIIIQKNRFRNFIMYIVGISFLVFTVSNLNLTSFSFDLTNSLQRLESLGNVKDIKGSRIGWNDFLDIIGKKLDNNPMGLGPGRTGAANSVSSDFIDSDPLYGRDHSWANDNLFISLAIDFGWGMIFYTILIFLFPLKLILYGILHFRKLDHTRYRLIMVSGICAFVFLIGNWGAISLPYNPESFLYWLWVSIGWREYIDNVRVPS